MSNDELALMETVEAGEWQSVKHLNDVKKPLMQAATETALKDTRINIRMAKRDVSALKTKALEQGVPYQTLIASVLHQHVRRISLRNPPYDKLTNYANFYQSKC